MSPDADVNATLLAFWRTSGNPPDACQRAKEVVREIEQRYRVAIPSDFRSYLLHIAPKENFWDQEDVIWWSPETIANILDEHPHPLKDPAIHYEASRCLYFADYCIWCWAWAVCCSEGENRGKVALINGASDRWIADSFTEFVAAYVQGPSLKCLSKPARLSWLAVVFEHRSGATMWVVSTGAQNAAVRQPA